MSKSKNKHLGNNKQLKLNANQLNRNGEFCLDLKDTDTRKKIMSRISEFKKFPVSA